MTGCLHIVAIRQRPGGLELGRGAGTREVDWHHNATLGQGSDGGWAIKCAHRYCQELQGVDVVGFTSKKLLPCWVLCLALFADLQISKVQ